MQPSSYKNGWTPFYKLGRYSRWKFWLNVSDKQCGFLQIEVLCAGILGVLQTQLQASRDVGQQEEQMTISAGRRSANRLGQHICTPVEESHETETAAARCSGCKGGAPLHRVLRRVPKEVTAVSFVLYVRILESTILSTLRFIGFSSPLTQNITLSVHGYTFLWLSCSGFAPSSAGRSKSTE